MRALSLRALSPIALLALVAFSSASVLHQVVPHEHGADSHFAQAIWENIHATLGHKKKQVTTEPVVLGEGEFARSIVSTGGVVLLEQAEFSPHKQETLLRRGVLAYRRFG